MNPVEKYSVPIEIANFREVGSVDILIESNNHDRLSDQLQMYGILDAMQGLIGRKLAAIEDKMAKAAGFEEGSLSGLLRASDPIECDSACPENTKPEFQVLYKEKE